MMEFIVELKEKHGITLTMLWMSIFCSVVLVIPNSLLLELGAANLVLNYTPYVWFIVLITSSFLLSRFIISFMTNASAKKQKKALFDRRNKMIRQLDFEEKAVLREFLIQRKNVLSLPMTEPAISNLLGSGVLIPAFETQEIKGNSKIIKMTISIEAREHLTHKVLGLPVGKLTTEEAELLKAARPDYARTNYIPMRD